MHQFVIEVFQGVESGLFDDIVVLGTGHPARTQEAPSHDAGWRLRRQQGRKEGRGH